MRAKEGNKHSLLLPVVSMQFIPPCDTYPGTSPPCRATKAASCQVCVLLVTGSLRVGPSGLDLSLRTTLLLLASKAVVLRLQDRSAAEPRPGLAHGLCHHYTTEPGAVVTERDVISEAA